MIFARLGSKKPAKLRRETRFNYQKAAQTLANHAIFRSLLGPSSNTSTR